MSYVIVGTKPAQATLEQSVAALTLVYLVDTQGNWASYETSLNKAKNRFFLRSVSKSENFGKGGPTEYASLYFDNCADSVDITGDFWRFIDARLGIHDFVEATNRHGTDFVQDFKNVFAKTDNDGEALAKWEQHLASFDDELLAQDLEVAC